MNEQETQCVKSGAQVRWSAVVSQHIRERAPEELAIGFARYEAIRKLNPRQYRKLHDRNMKGENFDSMVDALVLANIRLDDNDGTKPDS